MSLIATEFLKLRTQRAMRMLLLVAILFTVAGFALFAIGIRSATVPEVGLGNEVIQRQLLGVGGGALFIIIFAIVGITTEYRHETITWSFLGTPERYKVLLAKLVTYVIIAVLFGLVVAAISMSGMLILLQIEQVELVVPWATIVQDFLGEFAGLAIAAGFGFAIGATIVNQVVSIAIVIFESIVAPITMGLFPKVGRFLPSQASAAFLADQRFPLDGFLSPGLGALVIAGWLALLIGVALYVTQRRDIT